MINNLKNGDVVQVQVNGKWCNGIVISVKKFHQGKNVYVHYFKGIYDGNDFEKYGDSNYFGKSEIREYKPNTINKEKIKEIKRLAGELI